MPNSPVTIYPVLLCGGTGTRLWPLSRQAKPKQFLDILEKGVSLFQETLLRLKSFTANNEVSIAPFLCVGNGQMGGAVAHQFFIHEQLTEKNITANILLEPVAKDSGPAILAAAMTLQQQADNNGVMLILPCDHFIRWPENFYHAIRVGVEKWRQAQDAIITFGIHPHHPSQNYGYILPDSNGLTTADMAKDLYCLPIKNFKEKPSAATAQTYIDEGYMWNSGIFMCSAATVIKEYRRQQPTTFTLVEQAVKQMKKDPSPEWNFQWLAETAYQQLTPLSFDYAVMEGATQSFMVTANQHYDWGWSDLGSFDEIKRLHKNDANNNYSHPSSDANMAKRNAIMHQANNNLVVNQGEQTVALLGVSNIAVVSTKDALLVADMARLGEMKKLVAAAKQQNPDITIHHSEVHRPWGYYQSLKIDNGYQVKKLFLKPGAKISLQRHKHRSEHWVVVKGKALVTLNEKDITVMPNESVYIPVGTIHRLENIGKDNLELIEVQTGSYLGEDDIERLEDKYHRA